MLSPLVDPQFQSLYEIVSPLGRGGMGEVARIRHRVWEIDLAAKVPLPATVEAAGGFAELRREAEMWIRLPSHPNVVTCHYVRTFADTPVIFIEFVEGGSLADAIGRGVFQKGANTDALFTQALGIALDIAHGLAHAHAAGVVHQDIKPSNVLLDVHGAKITDFGIAAMGRMEAKAGVAQPTAAKTISKKEEGTMVATVVGMTPLYASPEQLATLHTAKRRVRKPITRATDIYSLGLTLLETLVGHADWQPGEVERVLDQNEQRVHEVSGLLRRMLSQDPKERPKASEVAAELSAHLGRRGVFRGPPMGAEMRADALNNRAVSLLDLDASEEARGLLREALLVDPCHPEAVFNETLLSWRAGESTDRGALERVRQAVSASEDWQAKLLEAWIQIERGDEKGAWTVLDAVAEHAAGVVRGTRAVARASRAVRNVVAEIDAFRASQGTADALALSHDEQHVVVGSRDGQIGIFERNGGRCVRRIKQAHAGFVFDVAITRDGQRIYSAGWDGIFTAHDAKSGERLFQEKHPGKIGHLVLSADERRAWTGCHSGTLRAWSLTEGGASFEGDWLALPNDLSMMCMALTPDGQTLIAGGEDNVLRFLDASTGELRRSLTLSSRPYSLAFTKEAGRDVLLVGQGDQQITFHDLATGEAFSGMRGLQSWVRMIALSPDRRWAVCNDGLHWSLWDVATRRCVRTVEAPALITRAFFLSSGEFLTLDWAGMVRRYVIEAPSVAPMVVALPRRSAELAAGRLAVDAALAEARGALAQGRVDVALAAGRRAREAKGFERAPDVLDVWTLLAGPARRVGVRAVWPTESFGPVKASSCLALSPSKGFVATADDKGVVRLWSLSAGTKPEPIREIVFPDNELAARSLAISADGKFLAIGTYKLIHVVDLDGGATRSTTLPTGYVRDVAFGGSEGSLLAALDDHGHAHVIRLANMERMATVRGPENWVDVVAFVGDDQLLVGDYDGHLLLWDIKRAAESGFLPGDWNSDSDRKPAPKEALIDDLGKFASGGSRSVNALKVVGDRVFYGNAEGALHVLDLRSRKRVLSLVGHKAPVSCFDFLDEDHVVTGSFDKTVRVFDLRSGVCLSVVEGHTHTIWDVVALDGQSFLTASDDEQVRRFHVDWELALG